MQKKINYNYNGSSDEIEQIIKDMKGATIEEVTTVVVESLGVQTHLKGFLYLKDAIVISVLEPSVLDQITKDVYPYVARKHHVDKNNVERNIRYAVAKVWVNGPDPERLHRLFCYTIGDEHNPSNLQFISRISERIRRYYNKVNCY